MLTLTLIRGLPGCGKSFLAGASFPGQPIFEADQFFLTGGAYKFDPSRLPDAHEDCRRRVLCALSDGVSCVVANTFTRRWEMEPYLAMAGVVSPRLSVSPLAVSVIDLFDGGCTDEQLASRNIHGVPLSAIQAMRKRYQFDWWNGSVER